VIPPASVTAWQDHTRRRNIYLLERNVCGYAISIGTEEVRADVLALTVQPHEQNSLRVAEVDDPEPGPDEMLVDGLALGVCGTDREIAGSRQAGTGTRIPGTCGSCPAAQRI
jgi:hypothetical protein